MPKVAPDVREERRRHLVNAAWRCAASTPFGELTIDSVCAAAGVSKGAFYGYFVSKDELLVALLEDDIAALDQVLDRLAGSDLTGIERVRRFAEALLALGEDPARVAVRTDIWASLRRDSVVRAQFSAAISRQRAILRGWIEMGVAQGQITPVPTNAIAAILLALTDGLLLHASLDAGAFRWTNIRQALDILLEGIGRV